MTKLSADFYAFLNKGIDDQGSDAGGWEALPVGPADPDPAPTPAPLLRSLSDVLHWCAPPAEVRAVLYALEEAGRLGPAGLAYLRKWEQIHEPGYLRELDFLPFMTAYWLQG
jgi:hypothetical protein